ncbi:RNA polymerase sigma factor SigJ [Singulisphaera sp. PoT]|uniref:RNA polymerase sigma factor SigJ n=1 Tax=Singulisphaera sp. PoT TaxID=3411797 RepID=UPI003BF530CD
MNTAGNPNDDGFESIRPRLLALAYRLLGSAADAEDAVQDAYLRLQQVGGVESHEGWLVKATTRLCIDRLRRAKRRAEYVGPWLPEPIPETWEPGKPDQLELAESLSMAFLILLESLSPAERAAYVLREVFDYEFDEIAEVLDKTAVNVRQITARAKKRLGQKDQRYSPDPGLAEDLAARFFDACRSGDLHSIESMLAEDAIYYSDGGGRAPAAPKPLVGTHRIANLLSVVFRKRQLACDLATTIVNGQPGVVFSMAGAVVQVLTFDSESGRISRLYSVLNPAKLRRWHTPGSPEPGIEPRFNDNVNASGPIEGPEE